MNPDKFEEQTERVRKHKKFGTIYLIPEISCEGCLGTTLKGTTCRELPGCGDHDGWVNEAGYIEWLDKVRMT